MNPANVVKFKQFTHEEKASAFNKLVEKHKRTIQRAIFKKLLFVPANEDMADYYQETLIYCWKYFERDYNGPIAPPYADGEPRSWDDWFYTNSKYGVINYWKKAHPKRPIKITSFCYLPEYFEPFETPETLDLEYECKLSSLEASFQNLSADSRLIIKTFLKNDLSNSATFSELGMLRSDQSATILKWNLFVLRHRTELGADRDQFFRFHNISFYDAAKYASEAYINNMWNKKGKEAYTKSYAAILHASKVLSLDTKPLSAITISDYLSIIIEMKKRVYQELGSSNYGLSRLKNLSDWLVDLGLLSCSPFELSEIVYVDGVLRCRALKSTSHTARPRYGNLSVVRSIGDSDLQKKSRGLAVVAMTMDNVPVERYDSINLATKKGYSHACIRRVLSGDSPSHQGLKWAYAETVDLKKKIQTA